MNVRASFGVLVCAGALSGCLIDLSGDPAKTPRIPLGPAPAVVQAETAPPAISGGTLLVTEDGTRAIAADPDRDVVWVVELGPRLVHRVDLERGDEPGRVTEDGAGRVHVALRRGGAVVTIDPVTATRIGRHPVCAAPRGLAWDAESDTLLIACVGGDLVEISAATGAEVRRVRLADDLRD